MNKERFEEERIVEFITMVLFLPDGKSVKSASE
jgi:hypothetical protein